MPCGGYLATRLLKPRGYARGPLDFPMTQPSTHRWFALYATLAVLAAALSTLPEVVGVGLDGEDDEEILGASTFAASVAVSRRISVLTFFGGLQMERSTLEVAYDLQPDPEVDPVPISFELTGAANARGTVGLGLNLGPLALHGSYSKSQVDVVRAGLGFSY